MMMRAKTVLDAGGPVRRGDHEEGERGEQVIGTYMASSCEPSIGLHQRCELESDPSREMPLPLVRLPLSLRVNHGPVRHNV